ncbi:DUF6090 family protein [Aestuariivivens sediminicola]|uniref:DUF6090 family protein n=1 Tax=Aestuariivivens sediminicola TaxID=2913560 RepID=UPI001F5933EA|nr:DUF6090 family protein [Aestuariivivens sediminicola]
MIKFFRKIRLKLLSQNKLSKYLLYAVGEIVLVMVGILLALQVNNWNEERKDDIRASNYMRRISEDLDRSINRSESLLKGSKSILKSVTDTQKFLERGIELNSEEKEIVDDAFLWFPRITYHIPNMLTYEEMKESGDLYLIEDIELRNELAEFHSYLERVEIIYEKLSRTIQSQFSVYNSQIRAYTDPETLDITFNYEFHNLTKDSIFINTFSRMTLQWRGVVHFMDQVNQISKKVKLKIEREK